MTTITKTQVKPTWKPEQVQEQVSRAWVNQYSAMMEVLCKHAPQAIEEFDNAVRARRVEYLKSHNVKTPLDLVKAMSEFEANAFGSKIEISGDDKHATMHYSYCGIYNAMQKYGNMSPEKLEKAGNQHAQSVQRLAAEFGLSANVEFKDDTCTITFTK